MPRARRPVLPAISQIVVGLLFFAFLAGTVAFVVAALLPEPERSVAPTDVAAGTAATPGQVTPSPDGSRSPDASPSPAPSPTAGSLQTGLMPIVPVVGFWEADQAISRAQLVAALEGRSERFSDVIVPAQDRQAIADALGARIVDGVVDGTPDEIVAAVQADALGLLRASDVTPLVHALAFDGHDLFGNTRVASVAEWPLSVALGPTTDEGPWDQSATWTLVAGGEVLLDRGVHQRVVIAERGTAYPFDGGTAVITGHACCGTAPDGTESEVPVYQTRGDAGTVRALMASAGLAIADLGTPTPDDWQYHPAGTTFTGDPQLLGVLAGAGIDWVSLADDHIADGGRPGIRDTVRHLPAWGLAGWGAGSDLAEARQWSTIDVAGAPMAILPCSSVPGALARPERAGARACDDGQLLVDIGQAADEGAAVVVFPHWGVEYQGEPTPEQRELAAVWLQQGADLVLGAHSHVVGPVEEFDGRLAFYSLGNLVSDEDWSELVMEGLIVEATFQGNDVVQVRLRPTLLHDRSQPNLLHPDRGGDLVIQRMRRLSDALLED
jgi:hypothetical protein